MALTTIPACHGAAVRLARGQTLRLVDLDGGQSGDLTAFRAGDTTEWLSNGRSFDYAGKIYLSTGDVLHSNRSNPMLTILSDDVGRHDFLYTACSNEMYRIQYGATEYHKNCVDNLAQALADQGVAPHLVPTPFNFFMHVTVEPDGRLVISPPRSRAGDAICLRAEMDLAIGLSACPAMLCNGGSVGPLAYEVLDPSPAA
ncbi:MAG TPA: urea carboxylase-associated family protein [Kofleriaceae bacterium]|nr:urea carboxylase-associated family protein [Kofleriaceae bacterium]